MFKRKKKKTGCETPEFRSKVPMPPVKPAKTNPPNTGTSVQRPCSLRTPCGWCTKWDKKCDKKIGCGNEKPQRGLRAQAGIFLDQAMSRSDAQEVIEAVKSGKLPPLNTNNTYGLEKRK